MSKVDWEAVHHYAADGLYGLADTFSIDEYDRAMTVGEVVALLRTTAELHEVEANTAHIERSVVVPSKRSPLTGKFQPDPITTHIRNDELERERQVARDGDEWAERRMTTDDIEEQP